MLAPADGEHAEIRVIDGRTFVSPWRMRLRVLAAMLSFREAEPMELWDQFVPKQDAPPRGARPSASSAVATRSAVSFCHQSPWHVPIRWFVLFGDEERWLGEDESGRDRGCATAPRTRRAMRRAEHAVVPLRRSELGPISDLIVDLHQWMAGVRPGVAPGARLRRPLRLHDAGTSWTTTTAPARSHEALDALEREEYPHGRRHLPGRPDAGGPRSAAARS